MIFTVAKIYFACRKSEKRKSKMTELLKGILKLKIWPKTFLIWQIEYLDPFIKWSINNRTIFFLLGHGPI